MFIKRKILLVSFICLCPILSFSNDPHGGGAEESHGESKGHSESEGPKVTGPAWMEVETQISALETKIRAKESGIEKLLEEKQHLDVRSPRIQEIMGEVSKETVELRKAKEDLEKQKTILHFRFPERGADPKRSYERHKEQTPEEMDVAVGVDGKLKKAFRRAQQQYGGADLKTTPSPEHHQLPDKNKSKRHLDVPEGVILQK